MTKISNEYPHRDRGAAPAPTTTPISKGGIHLSAISALRRTLDGMYYYATYSGRSWFQRRLATTGLAPIAVLTFHRVADDKANRWTTKTGNFVAAMRWLKRHFDMISLGELQRRVASGFNTRPAVCVTFDDGYAENNKVALPLLVEENIPCTYFVSSDPVLKGTPFPHDVEMGNDHLAVNTIEELKYWRAAGIEIGAHTRTHANLSRISDPKQLEDEVLGSRFELESALGDDIRYFAFPFGGSNDLSYEAFEVAKRGGFQGVCSAYGGWNHPGDPPFHIRRRCVDGPVHRAKTWAIVDPIREHYLSHFAYPDARRTWSPEGEQGAETEDYANINPNMLGVFNPLMLEGTTNALATLESCIECGGIV